MKLLTKAILHKLPPLYSGEEKGLEALAVVKFFDPCSSWAWYASEYDGGDIFFGLVDGHEKELGYFSLSELLKVRHYGCIGIERDMHWRPVTLQSLM